MKFQRDYGYEKPEKIIRWDWSYTFSKWVALVIFKDGARSYSYPKRSLINRDIKPELTHET